MEFVYNYNSLPTYSERDIILKDYLLNIIPFEVKNILKAQNRAWDLIRLESPCLIPRELISPNYTNEDLWVQEAQGSTELVLKPETTPATYAFMKHHMEHNSVMPPIGFYQASRSFRREQDQGTKHCRYKEFYQLEFQCLYTRDTKNNYQESVIGDLANMLMNIVGLPTRIVLSDRLPDYSLKTIDVEVFNGDKWMEICSVSLRNDFPIQPIIKNKPTECYVLEIAIGIDRLIYNINQRTKVFADLVVQNMIEEENDDSSES